MGRPKLDNSKNICNKCGSLGLPLTKTGQCRKCYQHDYDQEKYYKDPQAQIDKVKKWNKANPERRKAIKRAEYLRNPEAYKTRARKWELANKDRRNELARIWYKNNKSKVISQVYDITPEQYEKLVEEQDGNCGLCGKPDKLVLDHNHKTNEVRKLLCNRCNTLVGFLETSEAEVLASALDYVK